MILYLAASAPGNEHPRKRHMLEIENRLLSYYLIKFNKFECGNVFSVINNINKSKSCKSTKRNY